MPVNRDPSKKRRKPASPEDTSAQAVPETKASNQAGKENLDGESERDRELALTDAEWKNLWDATEVIDMDKW
ncbi:MAG: hypothetical protein ACREIS_06185 [Nitrospiraceae bacterium]